MVSDLFAIRPIGLARSRLVGLSCAFGLLVLGRSVAAEWMPGEKEYFPIEDPTPAAFSVCYDYGCAKVRDIGLEPKQWDRIKEVFAGGADDAAHERRLIADAVALMETIVGGLAGTDQDKGGNLSGLFTFRPQQDCVDESTNTTTYLSMMEKADLFRWHRVAKIKTRGFIIFGWPHNTAVIEDLATGERYAVDSWFFDNGMRPAIVPIAVWSDGWHPGDPLSSDSR